MKKGMKPFQRFATDEKKHEFVHVYDKKLGKVPRNQILLFHRLVCLERTYNQHDPKKTGRSTMSPRKKELYSNISVSFRQPKSFDNRHSWVWSITTLSAY